MNDLPATFSRTPLALLPTPVVPLKAMAETCGHDRLFMKQDNLSGTIYGGNKIRKLEFLLGEALEEGRKSVITYGAAGSNHALATAICCRELGLQAVSILAPQETSEHVRKNILMQHAVGADMHLLPHYTDFPAATRKLVHEYREKDGIDPYIIPAGGTNTIGALGFVHAAFELAEQIAAQPSDIPCPDVIYIPLGTGGTLAGLITGLKLAGLPTRVEAVRVVDPAFRTEEQVQKLCHELCAKLETDIRITESDICIRDEYLGPGYGITTPEAAAAVEVLKAKENIYLETTYTGKTVAALLHDLQTGQLEDQTVLYWNTLNSRDLSGEIDDIDPRALPPEFQSYF